MAGYLGLSEVLRRMDRMEERMLKVEENQERLWETVKRLEEGQNRLWKHVKSGFGELREMLGVTFEATARAFIAVLLDEMGYPEARVGVKHFAVDGEVVEVDAFCEDPLVVGEITGQARSRDEAEEVSKLVTGSPSRGRNTAGGCCWRSWWWRQHPRRSPPTRGR